MFRNKKEEQIQDLHIDSFLGSLFRTASGGHPSRNRNTAAYEARRRKLEERFKAEIALKTKSER